MERLALFFCLFAVIVAAMPVRGTTFAKMSLAEMSQHAQQIIRARCVSNTAAWDAGEIWTFTFFDVEESWRGSARGRIAIRLLGGRTAQFTSRVSGVPQFQPGEEVILFLEPTSRGDFSIVSWQQGTFRIRRDARSATAVVTQDTASLGAFDPATRRFVSSGIRDLPIAALRSQVEDALAHSSMRGAQ